MLTKRQSKTLFQSPLWAKTVGNPDFLVGLIITAAIVLSAIFADKLTPYTPDSIDLRARLLPPFSPGHLLGTDPVGRDVLTRIIYGSRVSLIVGTVSVGLGLVIGTAVGLIAGYHRGLWDTLLMRLADIQLAFPFILLAITVIAVIGPGLWKLIFVMVITQWVQYARVVRGQVMSLREREFIQASKALGAPSLRILLRHILPNAIGPVIVLATLNVANNILLESGLTFLGLGVDPLVPSWGGMLADGRNYMQTAWWVAAFPGLAITITVLGINLLGDWLRDQLDPLGRSRDGRP